MLSTWIVVTDSEPEDVFDHLDRYVDPNDRLFVGPLGKPAAWRNVIAERVGEGTSLGLRRSYLPSR